MASLPTEVQADGRVEENRIRQTLSLSGKRDLALADGPCLRRNNDRADGTTERLEKAFSHPPEPARGGPPAAAAPSGARHRVKPVRTRPARSSARSARCGSCRCGHPRRTCSRSMIQETPVRRAARGTTTAGREAPKQVAGFHHNHSRQKEINRFSSSGRGPLLPRPSLPGREPAGGHGPHAGGPPSGGRGAPYPRCGRRGR